MSEEEGKMENDNENENGQEEEGSMNVYDDNAYMFGDDPSGDNSEEQQDYYEINKEEKEEVLEKKFQKIGDKDNMDFNKVKMDFNKNEIQEGQNIELMDDKKKILNKLKVEDNINNDNEDKEKKIGAADNQISGKINIDGNDANKKKEIKKKENEKENMNINDHEIPNEEYEENEGGEEEAENGEMDEENEGEGEEEENIPLVTLKFISICQFCKNSFNSTIHLPYLLKCGHFFCLKCIKEHFTDEEGIKCPNDGLVALSIKELKLLNNLITDKTILSQRDKKEINTLENEENMNGIENNNNNMKLNDENSCKIHKGQRLTHIVTETKQLVCVYCAFDLVRKNPKCEVKEIKEKFDEFVSDAEKIINLNQNNIKIIQDSLKDIKKNKEIEEKNINTYFDHIFKYLTNKKTEYLSQIDSIFTDNAKKLSQKLEIFSEQIELGESLKGIINNYDQNCNFDEILETYAKLQAIKSNDLDYQINLQEYKFSHDDETKIMKYINNFGDIKTINKYIAFQNGKKDPFNLKMAGSQGPIPLQDEPKKNYFNFNSNPIITNMAGGNKSSSRFSNNSTDNQELINEMGYNNNNLNNNKKSNYNNNNYNFNFNKINPMTNNSNSNANNKRNISSKPIILSNNAYRHGSTELNNGNINYINIDTDNREKNYSFTTNNNAKNMRGNRINNGDNKMYNNFYNLNHSKKMGDKDNSNQNISNKVKNTKSTYENPIITSLGYEYKGFKTFNFNK